MSYFIGIPINLKEIPIKLTEPYYKIPEDQLHITLIYIGSLKEREVNTVRRILNEVASGHKAFKIMLHGIILLPSSIKPRYLALSVTKGTERLSELRNEILTKLTDAKISLRDAYLNEFKPHITFARTKAKPSDIPQKLIKKLMRIGKGFKEEVEVRGVILYEASRGVYKVISKHKLLAP